MTHAVLMSLVGQSCSLAAGVCSRSNDFCEQHKSPLGASTRFLLPSRSLSFYFQNADSPFTCLLRTPCLLEQNRGICRSWRCFCSGVSHDSEKSPMKRINILSGLVLFFPPSNPTYFISPKSARCRPCHWRVCLSG